MPNNAKQDPDTELCLVSLCLVSLCRVSLCRVSLCYHYYLPSFVSA
jgi:hypothetical protein